MAAVIDGLVVRIRDLTVLADIGINPDEIGRRQPLVIQVELTLSSPDPNNIEGMVDYRSIARAAEALAETHIPLIETFAQRLATQCLSWPPVAAVRITVDKPFALAWGLAGVELRMRRPDCCAPNPHRVGGHQPI
ncbi:hypothetical protein ASE00_10105 [Sphingomonas sp. Root710]|uniref:dihydroneopterin aldolase n=1 Tax=Sphingomonas sp. Root710 TaxID=1736594 RepID=UPI0006FA6245|nr:dihydroneopterin aldolase [Sphingomonas sp. Root710]KRB82410.1 hypothetical protein ASE00_10105 [Sphingomonas sp. Root710]